MKRPPSSDAAPAPAPERPPIWIDGRQQPKFDLRAWAVVGHGMARRALLPRLGRASAGLASFGAEVAGGRYRLATSWMGRAERFVPSKQSVGAGLIGMAARLAEARAILAPKAEADLAYPDLIRRPPPAASATPQRVIRAPDPSAPLPAPAVTALSLAADNPGLTRAAPEEPTLSAIRALIHAVPDPSPAEAPDAMRTTDPGPRATPPPPTADAPALHRKLGSAFARQGARLGTLLAAHAIAWGSLGLTLPFGLAKAALYHLNGGDLREWE